MNSVLFIIPFLKNPNISFAVRLPLSLLLTFPWTLLWAKHLSSPYFSFILLLIHLSVVAASYIIINLDNYSDVKPGKSDLHHFPPTKKVLCKQRSVGHFISSHKRYIGKVPLKKKEKKNNNQGGMKKRKIYESKKLENHWYTRVCGYFFFHLVLVLPLSIGVSDRR